jgi:hypothetical protein
MGQDHLSEQPCMAKACEIQTCLFNNDYDESKCYLNIMNLYSCCFDYYNLKKKEAPNTEFQDLPLTTSCPKYTVLVQKTEKLKQENQ